MITSDYNINKLLRKWGDGDGNINKFLNKKKPIIKDFLAAVFNKNLNFLEQKAK